MITFNSGKAFLLHPTKTWRCPPTIVSMGAHKIWRPCLCLDCISTCASCARLETNKSKSCPHPDTAVFVHLLLRYWGLPPSPPSSPHSPLISTPFPFIICSSQPLFSPTLYSIPTFWPLPFFHNICFHGKHNLSCYCSAFVPLLTFPSFPSHQYSHFTNVPILPPNI